MYKKLSVIITTQKKRKKRKCVQSKTIDCEVIGKIKPVKGGWVDIDSIYKLNMFNSLHLFPSIPPQSLCFFPDTFDEGVTGYALIPNVLKGMSSGHYTLEVIVEQYAHSV